MIHLRYVTALLIAFYLYVQNCPAQTGRLTLTVEVTDIRNDNGFIMISLFDNKEHFPNEEAKNAVAVAQVSIKHRTAKTTFHNLQEGKYAVAVLHDENGNKKLDQNRMGIPREGYGFSNNAKGNFGPPDFEQAAFRLTAAEQHITIKAHYILR